MTSDNLPAVVEATPLPQPKEWTAHQRAFIEWLALPKHLREPPTQEKFAAVIGYHPVTICDWKKLPGFGAAVVERTKELLRSDSIAEILHSHSKLGIDDVKSARLILEAAQVISRDTRAPAQTGPQVVIYNDNRRRPEAIDAIAD